MSINKILKRKQWGSKIEVSWVDACSINGWKTVEEAKIILDEVYCYSRGWYVHHDKDFLVICRDKGKTKNNDVAGVLYIPMKCIKKCK